MSSLLRHFISSRSTSIQHHKLPKSAVFYQALYLLFLLSEKVHNHLIGLANYCFLSFYLQIGAFSILAVGIWTIVDKSYLQDLMRNKLYMSAAYVLIAVGAITIILSLIGCLGSFTVRTRLKILISLLFCQTNTVFFLKLDRGVSFLEGKLIKIIGLVEIAIFNVKIMMVNWVRH